MLRLAKFWILILLGVIGLSGWYFSNSSAQLTSPDCTPRPPLPASYDKASGEEKAINADLIRVGISDDAMTEMEYRRTRISANGDYKITDKGTGTVIDAQVPAWQVLTVTVDKDGFYLRKRNGGLISGSPFKGPVVFEPVSSSGRMTIVGITRKGKQPYYRGMLEVTRGYSAPNKLSVVNILPMQDYLKAVVPNELPPRYGLEALKAQAIAARNYALRPRDKVWPQFDICDSQYCQAYYGANTEMPETNQALRETQGLVGLYKGEIILALYSSAHGGFGEKYANAFSDPLTQEFPAPDIPYLAGGPDIPNGKFQDLSSESAARAYWTNPYIESFDVNSSYHRWEKRWNRRELERSLNEKLREASEDTLTRNFVQPHLGPNETIGTFKRVNVTRRGISGKAMEVEIIGTNGRWILQKEFVIRKVFSHGDRFLPSANVVFSHMTGKNGKLVYLKANGGGFGHGVGMSQLGASWMAKHGYTFPAIIQHYYKGVSIGSVPLKVGPDDALQPVKNSFFAKAAKPSRSFEPTLHVKSDVCGGPVKVKLNDQIVTVNTADEQHVTLAVGDFIKPGTINTMVLYPDDADPARPIKAWVELIPPQD